MARPLKMKNAIQPYAWGSLTAIAELTGTPSPSNQPEAELWMGAHPKAPSRVWYQGRWQSLDEMIQQDPTAFLGASVVNRFGPQLPYLFKVLAVDQPLSIQAHPDKAMARKGFALENEQGISMTAPQRNYRDANHKPECVCALTPFTALCGFRSIAEIRSLLEPIWPGQRQAELEPLATGDETAALKYLFNHLMRLPSESRKPLIRHVVDAVQPTRDEHPVHDWMAQLNEAYPDDIGVLSPCLLQLVTLQPGQALFLPSGKLHAYLQGVSIEVMANSDNVLRGGLTPKHVDIEELLKVLSFDAHPLEILEPQRIRTNHRRYASQAEEFALEAISVNDSGGYDSGERSGGPEIVLCIEGQAEVSWGTGGNHMTINQGESFIVPADVERYEMTGFAEMYKTGVNQRLLEQ